ncbi:hypothetical protein HMI54_001308 [Coelomomyces lativittatus]|nr:hypothetical protein HMI55_002875 [Coelomomyces lativittatus]KAJ1504363.1 hypothetical protein HMI56_001666 [Coelomomyces lativittatus]KAJ1510831.1 hypothetical protein HMI54_001308 [Coelomomyces lativittatus]
MPPSINEQVNGIHLSTLLQTYALILFQLYKLKCNHIIEPLYAHHPNLARYFQWFFSIAAFPIAIFILYCGFTLFFITAVALISAALVQCLAMLFGVTLLFSFLSALGLFFTLIHLYRSFVLYLLRQTELQRVAMATSFEASEDRNFSRLRSLLSNSLNMDSR